MKAEPRIIATSVPARPDGVVLVLHGGGSRRGNMMVSPTQLSVLRMIPIARRIARSGGGRLAVFRLLNSVRGWDSKHTPADDARWALHRLRSRFGESTRFAMVGHSLGGRAALLAAGAPGVSSVVALAPWVYPDDAVTPLPPGRRILIVHGSDDRIAAPRNSERVAATLARSAEVAYLRVRGGKHAMLSHHRLFDGVAADFVRQSMLNTPPKGVAGRLLSGESFIEI